MSMNTGIRVGNFSSSGIWQLLEKDRSGKGTGKRAFTYMNQKRMERKMGRSMEVDVATRPMLWGKMGERYVHQHLLDTKYKTQGDVTIVHPNYPFWVGSPDNIIEREKVVGDTKCYYPLNFGEYVECLTMCADKDDVSLFRQDFKEEYWQLVSNACILGYKKIEAIVFMPYRSELANIRLMVANYDGYDQYKYRFIYEGQDEDLPHLPNDCKEFKNLNIFRFDVPDRDIEILTKAVIDAERYINPTVHITLHDPSLPNTTIHDQVKA